MLRTLTLRKLPVSLCVSLWVIVFYRRLLLEAMIHPLILFMCQLPFGYNIDRVLDENLNIDMLHQIHYVSVYQTNCRSLIAFSDSAQGVARQLNHI
jgi:hypothetical protein